MTELYRGHIVYSKSGEELAVHKNSWIAVEDGTVEGIYEVLPEKFKGLPVRDFGNGVIIPAFSDLHVHAPQYPQRGLAMDLLLEDWLNNYTFPLEARYADLPFARAVYEAFVDDLIANGTMHACIFGTIHPEATGFLLTRLEEKGLSAFVGKVNMDKASPAYLCETTEDSLRETESFLERYSGQKTAKPILTPRFAPTCTAELLKGLGKLGRKYHTGMQTHLVESKWEAHQALADFPDVSCDTEIYERAGLMDNGPVIAAHFIFQLHKTARKQQHLTSLVCQRDRVVDTFKQHAAEFLLELADLERNRRLGIPLYLRGLCKTAEFRGQHKSFQAFIIHIFTINFANVLFLIYTLPRIFSRNQ